MHQANTQEAAVLFYIEALGKIQGVVVSIPSIESTVSQRRREFQWSVAGNAYGDRRAALVKAARIGNAVNRQAGDGADGADVF